MADKKSLGVSFSRTNAVPLDDTSTFDTFDNAKAYVESKSSTSYTGQLITVKEKLYVVVADAFGKKTLQEMSASALTRGYAQNSIQQEDCIAGCKGYYIKSVDTINKKIYLTDIQQVPSLSVNESEDINPLLAVDYVAGDILFLRTTTWFTDLTISSVENNVITYTEEGLTNSIFDGSIPTSFNHYTACVKLKPSKGIIPVTNSTVALGQGTIASGRCGVAAGDGSKALGEYSIAFGYKTIAQNSYSYAEGLHTVASGTYGSHAEGDTTVASGQGSHAEGNHAIASGLATHAEGYKTTASGNQGAHSEGGLTIAFGVCSHAEGYKTEAIGDCSHVEGEGSKTTERATHAEGYYSVASKIGAHAEGYQTQATGKAAHAEGESCYATGARAHAEGAKCKATANQAHAGGLESVADHSGSFVHGLGLNTSRDYQFVVGQYNNYEDPDALFVIGNGSGTEEDKRSNAFTVTDRGIKFKSYNLVYDNYEGFYLPEFTQPGDILLFQLVGIESTMHSDEIISFAPVIIPDFEFSVPHIQTPKIETGLYYSDTQVILKNFYINDDAGRPKICLLTTEELRNETGYHINTQNVIAENYKLVCTYLGSI